MHKPKIVVFIPTLSSGGAEKQAMILANVLQERYSTFLVIWDGRRVEEKFRHYVVQNNISHYYLKGSIFTRFYKFYTLLKENKIDIIFNYLASANFYGAIAGKMLKIPFIIGGVRNAEIPTLKLIIQKFLHNYFFNYTIFNNYTGCENLIDKGFSSSKCIVIPNCFEKHYGHIIRKLKSPVLIVSLARFVAQKDYYTALKAFHHLINSYQLNNFDVRYRIIGYGELEGKIYRWIKEFDLQNFTEVIINPDNALDLVNECDIFLITSLFEGTSNSIMEAMSLSLPIVATLAGDNSYLVEENKNGFLSKPKDYEHVSSNLYKLVIDPSLRLSFGKYSNEKLYKEFSINSFKESHFNFINSLIDEQKS